MSCPLCKLSKGEIKTHLYHQNDKIIIVDCLTCGGGKGVPLIVLKRHTMSPITEEVKLMLKMGHKVGKKVFGEGKYKIDRKQRAVKTHYHWHVRRR